MSLEAPQERQKEVLDDNARKFALEAIDPTLLEAEGVSAYTLITDWLETGEDNEKKVVYKQFDTGDVQILLISKVTKDGKRVSEKEKITEERYRELLSSSILHLEKNATNSSILKVISRSRLNTTSLPVQAFVCWR